MRSRRDSNPGLMNENHPSLARLDDRSNFCYAEIIALFQFFVESKMTQNQLRIFCRKHPHHDATKATRSCASCSLLYILRYQHSKEPDKHLGGVDPYQFIGDLKDACEGLEVWLDKRARLGKPKPVTLKKLIEAEPKDGIFFK